VRQRAGVEVADGGITDAGCKTPANTASDPMTPEKEFPGFKVERFPDDATGKATVRYLLNGVMIDHVKLSGAVAERLSGLALIEKDLKNSLKWISRAQILVGSVGPFKPDAQYVQGLDREVFDDVKAFFVAALSFYAKAFTEANGRRAQMTRDWLAPEFRSTHDFYMEMRHNFAAHSGDQKVEEASTHVLLVPDGQNYRVRLHTNRNQPDLALADFNGKTFTALIENAIGIVTQRFNDLAVKVGETVVSIGLGSWLLAAGDSNPVVNIDKQFNVLHKRKK
jgi:hypothetical protein